MPTCDTLNIDTNNMKMRQSLLADSVKYIKSPVCNI